MSPETNAPPSAVDLLQRSRELAVRIAGMERVRANAGGMPEVAVPVGDWQYRDTPGQQLESLREELFHTTARGLRGLLRDDPEQLRALAATADGLSLLAALLPEELDAFVSSGPFRPLRLPASGTGGGAFRLEAVPSHFPPMASPAGDVLVVDDGRSVVVSMPHGRRVHVLDADGTPKNVCAWPGGLPFGLFPAAGRDVHVCDVSGQGLVRMALDGALLDRINLADAAPGGEECLNPYFGAMFGNDVVLRTANPSGDAFRVVRFDPAAPAATWRALNTEGLGPVNHLLAHDGTLYAGEMGTGRIFRYDEALERFLYWRSTGLGGQLYRFSLCNGALFSLSGNCTAMTDARGRLVFATSLARHFGQAGDSAQTVRAHEQNGLTTLYVAGHALHLFRLSPMNL